MSETLMQAVSRGCTVLTPNAELAAALIDSIERSHRTAGRALWNTPRVREFGGWLVDRHLDEPQPGGAHARVLSELEERELWLEVVKAVSVTELAMEPGAAARAARRARRAMVDYGIPLEALRMEPTEETAVLLEWSARFDARCRELECMSADALWPGRASVLPPGPSEPVAWIESSSWRPVVRRWLESSIGPPLEAHVVRSPADSAAPRRVCFGSSIMELAAVAAWSEALAASTPEARVWICIPDLEARRAAVEDAFDAALEPQRHTLLERGARAPRYAIAGGVPLAQYRPVRAALELLGASRGLLEFEQFSALLRAPELMADPLDVAAARLDLELRRVAPSEAPLMHWLELAERCARGARIAALERLRSARILLEQAAGRQLPSRWVRVWVSAFEAAPWSNRASWNSRDYQAAQRCRELLAALATADRLFGALSRAAADALFRRAVQEVRFQPQTGVPPVWVSSQLHDPYLAYAGIWVAGLDAQRWPPPPAPVPLLPVRLQRRYGVIAASAEAQLAHARRLQTLWRERAGELRFSSAAAGTAQSGEVSALLADVACHEAEAGSILVKPHWRSQRLAAPELERLEETCAPPPGVEERTRGVGTLKAQSRCAFQGFAFTRLALEPLRSPAPGFADHERGQLLHDALEHLWTELKDSAALAAHTAATLAPLLAESAASAISKARKRRDPGLRWREREQVRLEHLLAHWLEVERVRMPFVAERLEMRARTLSLAGLKFEVRIDRVDRLDDGSYVLIDYKTGAAVVDWQRDRPKNPQLPVYALALRKPLAAVAYGRVNAAGCGFVPETDRRGVFKPTGRVTSLEGAASLAALVPLWAQRIERIAAQFAAGRAVLDPLGGACSECRFQAVCRVDPTLIEYTDE